MVAHIYPNRYSAGGAWNRRSRAPGFHFLLEQLRLRAHFGVRRETAGYGRRARLCDRFRHSIWTDRRGNRAFRGPDACARALRPTLSRRGSLARRGEGLVMANLEIRSVSKEFKTGKVLDRISLAADNGEIVAIFGPSGSGKTVLLRLVAGVEQPDEGSIFLGGRDVTDQAPEKRGVGMAFQNFALFPHMSAFDNVASALTAHNVPRDVIRAKVEKVAALLKIEHVLQHAPRELSNGQKQRTALARALVAEPKILLLDDPLRNVDAKLRYEMRLELPSLLKASGSTVLYVTQDYKEAMALGDRIAVLSDRDFAQIARPAEVYRSPATINVASLFGDPTINLMPVEPRASPGSLKIQIGGAALSLPVGYGHMAGKACVLGVRAENIVVEDTGSPESIPVEVVAVTPLNERTLLLLRTDDGHEILASEAGTNEAPRRHGRAFARFNPESVLLFDPASGRRILPQRA